MRERAAEQGRVCALRPSELASRVLQQQQSVYRGMMMGDRGRAPGSDLI
jgi:hypothetical protein